MPDETPSSLKFNICSLYFAGVLKKMHLGECKLASCRAIAMHSLVSTGSLFPSLMALLGVTKKNFDTKIFLTKILYNENFPIYGIQ